MKAQDLFGEVPIYIKTWVSSRKTSGNLSFIYKVVPSSIHGDALGVHRDSGGLVGCGLAFVPIPPGNNIYRNIVEWDLSRAPKETRGVWSFGEGLDVAEKVGPDSILNDSVYMVGPIESFPSAPIARGISDYYGYYWFGSLQPNINVIQKIHHDFLMKIAEFFEDIPTRDNPYRTFVRNRGHVEAFGGTCFTRSHIFDYDRRIDQAEDNDLVRRISHNWLGPSIPM